jgi:hypothetical protein
MEVGQGPNWGCSAKRKKKNGAISDHGDDAVVPLLQRLG